MEWWVAWRPNCTTITNEKQLQYINRFLGNFSKYSALKRRSSALKISNKVTILLVQQEFFVILFSLNFFVCIKLGDEGIFWEKWLRCLRRRIWYFCVVHNVSKFVGNIDSYPHRSTPHPKTSGFGCWLFFTCTGCLTNDRIIWRHCLFILFHIFIPIIGLCSH